MAWIETDDGRRLFATEIQHFRRRCLVVCDRNCEKAWGHNGGRPTLSFDDDNPDDFVYLADSEVGQAPDDPGTYEGWGEGKPNHPERHSRWCVRECERSDLVRPGQLITCRDLSHRLFNQPWKHGIEDNPKIRTGKLFS